MSLARAHTWNAGDLLKANDLNGEFNNILNNPISLISPTTGVITFTTAQTFPFGQVVATSAARGDLLVGTTGGTFGTQTIGTSGQILAVSSSTPTWLGTVPTSAHSTDAASAGGTVFFSTAASPLLAILPIGTSGQVLTVSTALKPSWATPAASGSGGGNITVSSSMVITMTEEFYDLLTSDISGVNSTYVSMPAYIPYAVSSGTVTWSNLTTNPSGVVVGAVGDGTLIVSRSSTNSGSRYDTIMNRNPDFSIIFGPATTGVTRGRLGLVGTTGTNPLLFASTTNLSNDCLFFQFSGTSGGATVVSAIGRVGGNEFTVTTTLRLLSSIGEFGLCRFQMSSSGTLCTVYTNGVTAGTFTSSQMPTSTSKVLVAFGSSEAQGQPRIDAWQLSQLRSSAFV